MARWVEVAEAGEIAPGEGRQVAIGGLRIRWAETWSSTHLYDSENLHHTVDKVFDGGMRLGVVLVEQDTKYYAGLSFGTSF